ncbi:hypothetical protein BBJ28_00012762 [Nothophytophthora sp. Chile5]|nr:hypothetical protein BBJ28_00012762 [Nothophytophthora sp. Chile5]
MFLPGLKQMLDTMENYSVLQVRKMYDVLFAVGGHEDSDLCNILLKQAFHQETRYRCFGILGAVSRLGRLLEFFREATAPTTRGGTGGSETGRESLKASAAKEFTVCMTELHRSYLSDTKCFAFMLEELTDFIEKLELDELGLVLVSNIFNYYLEFFQTRFMEDFDAAHCAQYSKTVMSGAMKSELWLNIDAKLVANLQMFFIARESVLRELSALDRSVQNAVCTTLWHAINWVRSIINFFCTEAKNYYVAKTTERLENLSRLETILLDEVLPSCPAFAIPRLSGGGIDQHQSFGKTKSLFDPTERKKPGRPPKVSTTVDRATLVKKSFLPLKSEVISILAFPRVLDSVIRGGSNDRLETAGGERSSGFALKTVRIELLFSLFRYHMDWCAGEEKPKSSFSWGTVAHTSGWKENVLAHDVASKSSSKLLAELSTAGVLNATEKYASHFLAVIKEHGEDESASEGEETKEGDQPAPSTSLVKRILCEYLEIVVLFLNSKNDPAADVVHVQQLQSFLLPESERAEYTSSDSNSLIKITSKCFKVMLQYQSVVGDNIKAGVALLKCLTSLLSLAYGFDASQVINYATSIDMSGRQQRDTNSTKSAMAAQLSNLALSYLQRDWSNSDSRYAYKNAHLEVILRCCIHHDPIVLDRIQTLAIDGFVELLEQNGKRVEGYPTLDKKTVGIYHRVMFDALVAVTSRLDVSSNDERFVFSYLMQAVLLFKMLVCMTKGFHKAMLISTVLKVGRKFIEMFLRIMPFLEEQFQLHSSRVVKLFSEVQVATRRMQVLCAHGKLVKDQATASQVPMVKKLLEKLIYRGEMLASANGVLHAYKTGVLRNKRLDGTTISQEQDSDDSSEEDEASEKDDGSGGEEEETQVGQEEETHTDEELPCDEETGEQEEKDEEGAPPAAKRSR